MSDQPAGGLGRIFCIGESLLDLVFEGRTPLSARPGGSSLNAAVSLGRTGLPVFLISETGVDEAGRIISAFLKRNHVSTRYLHQLSGHKTAIALAFLDRKKDAGYSFYRDYPEERFTQKFPEPTKNDLIIFGSSLSYSKNARKSLIPFLEKAAQKGTFIIFDPNFRPVHLPDLTDLKPMIIENIGLSALVRGSHEDFMLIFAAANAREAYQQVRLAGCDNLVYTNAQKEVIAFSPDKLTAASVPEIDPVSTIGAGDAFNAGIAWYLWYRPDVRPVSATKWDHALPELLNCAIRFSAGVCLSMENYISEEFAGNLKKWEENCRN